MVGVISIGSHPISNHILENLHDRVMSTNKVLDSSVSKYQKIVNNAEPSYGLRFNTNKSTIYDQMLKDYQYSDNPLMNVFPKKVWTDVYQCARQFTYSLRNFYGRAKEITPMDTNINTMDYDNTPISIEASMVGISAQSINPSICRDDVDMVTLRRRMQEEILTTLATMLLTGSTLAIGTSLRNKGILKNPLVPHVALPLKSGSAKWSTKSGREIADDIYILYDSIISSNGGNLPNIMSPDTLMVSPRLYNILKNKTVSDGNAIVYPNVMEYLRQFNIFVVSVPELVGTDATIANSDSVILTKISREVAEHALLYSYIEIAPQPYNLMEFIFAAGADFGLAIYQPKMFVVGDGAGNGS